VQSKARIGTWFSAKRATTPSPGSNLIGSSPYTVRISVSLSRLWLVEQVDSQLWNGCQQFPLLWETQGLRVTSPRAVFTIGGRLGMSSDGFLETSNYVVLQREETTRKSHNKTSGPVYVPEDGLSSHSLLLGRTTVMERKLRGSSWRYGSWLVR